jgi:hypothetical protein
MLLKSQTQEADTNIIYFGRIYRNNHYRTQHYALMHNNLRGRETLLFIKNVHRLIKAVH